MKFNTIIEDEALEIEFSDSLNDLTINSQKKIKIDCNQIEDNSYSLIINDKSHFLSIRQYLDGYQIKVDQYTFIVKVEDEFDILLKDIGIENKKNDSLGNIYAQIPGLISRVFVKIGDNIKANQKLFILEAMKMENEITSPLSGKVNNIYYQSGDKVEKGNLIMDIIN